jgi:hypothetical protein
MNFVLCNKAVNTHILFLIHFRSSEDCFCERILEHHDIMSCNNYVKYGINLTANEVIRLTMGESIQSDIWSAGLLKQIVLKNQSKKLLGNLGSQD